MGGVKRLYANPLFLIGLGIRLALLAFVTPYATAEWYAPFLGHSLAAPSLDPWTSFLKDGGNPLAFPYGYSMWIILLPFSALASLAGLSSGLGYASALLAVDVLMLAALRRLSAVGDQALLALYWLSPITLFATYWLGLNDLIPVLILILALVFLHEGRARFAGAFAAVAVSAKLSMVLATPFLAIYLFNNRRLRAHFVPFVVALGAAAAVLLGPFLLSPGGQQMLFSNPELAKVYASWIPMGELRIYLLPLVYLLTVFAAWRMRRMSFDLLLVLLGIAFFLVLILTPAAPGWFVWVMPFVVLYQAGSGKIAVFLVAVFSLLYVGGAALIAPLPAIGVVGWPAGVRVADLMGLGRHFLSLYETLLLAAGIVIAARMLREGIQANEYFRLSRRPLVVGIAGDSGSGKDRLVDAIAGLFGEHSVVRVSGDSYHLWDRQKPMWQVMTHLNPRANDLASLAHDLQSLVTGRAVRARRYDHGAGRIGAPARLESNDFILVSGLHALYLPLLRELYDVAIFLDMSEPLRQHLKKRRDVEHRGHSEEAVDAALAKRAPDAERYIRPQVGHADLVLALEPVRPDALADNGADMPLKLVVRGRQGMYYDSLVRVLIGICGLSVDMTLNGADGSAEMIIEGETGAEDIALAAHHLLPELTELLDIHPSWQPGMLGVMQIVALVHITQALRSRLS